MDFKVESSVTTYLVEIPETKGAIKNYASDDIFCKSTDTVEFVNIYIKQTDFNSYDYYLLYENILVASLKNLWYSYKYNEKYISFLLDLSSKEEFMQYVEESTPEMRKIDETELLLAAHIINQIIDEPLSSIDLSAFLCVAPIDIELAISKFHHVEPVGIISDETSE